VRTALGAALVALGVALVGRPLPARAAEPLPAAEPAREHRCGGAGPAVSITWLDIAEPEALERAVCDWFRDEPWRVRFTTATPPARAARSSGAVLRVLVRLASPGQASLLVQTGRDPAWSYDVVLPGPLDAAGVEVLAQALHSTVQAAAERIQRPATAPPPRRDGSTATTTSRPPSVALPAGATIPPTPATSTATPPPATSTATRSAVAATRAGSDSSTSRADGTAPALGEVATPLARDEPVNAGPTAAPAPLERAGSPLPVHTGLGYLGLWRGDEPPIHGPTLRIGVDARRRGPTLGGYFRGTLFTSGTRHGNGLSVRSSGVSLGAGASLAAPMTGSSEPFEARLALGAGVDLLALDVRVTDPSRARLSADRRARPRPFLGAEAGAAWRSGPLELELSLLLRWQVLHTTYDVLDPAGQRSTLFEPWRLQPGASLAAAYVW
jgi:hypothetical protein